VTVELTTPACPLKEVIERDVTNALRKIGADPSS
jgi:metal-sulfur cluster biosynthetic enzyme